MNHFKQILLLIMNLTFCPLGYGMLKDLPEITPRGSYLSRILSLREIKQEQNEPSLKETKSPYNLWLSVANSTNKPYYLNASGKFYSFTKEIPARAPAFQKNYSAAEQNELKQLGSWREDAIAILNEKNPRPNLFEIKKLKDYYDEQIAYLNSPSITEHVKLSQISDTLAVFKARILDAEKNPMLSLEIFRNKHADMPGNAILNANLYTSADFEIPPASDSYDSTDNNYMIRVNLVGSDLSRSTISIHPASQVLIDALKTKKK